MTLGGGWQPQDAAQRSLGDGRVARSMEPSPSPTDLRLPPAGVNEADLLRSCPTLRAEDLTNAWAYFRAYPEEIEQQIRENEEA